MGLGENQVFIAFRKFLRNLSRPSIKKSRIVRRVSLEYGMARQFGHPHVLGGKWPEMNVSAVLGLQFKKRRFGRS
jgi:hypothetical protein